MEDTKNKIRVHCCGGAGVNIGDKVLSRISELGDGFADIDISYIDTSRSNINTVTHNKDHFYMIKANDHSDDFIEGSGGERAKHSTAIRNSVMEYLNENKIFKPIVNEYHLVVSSASGGSGNMISAFITDLLLKRNIPVITLLVGDSTNALYAKNTAKSLATLHNIAKSNKKALTIMYVNNHNYIEEHGLAKAEESANEIIFNSVSTLALFLSGQNESIDAQDMANIITQTNYTSLDVKHGLYGLGVFTKNVLVQADVVYTVSRTLTVGDGIKDINIKPAYNSKAGTIISENAINVFKNQCPIHLVAYANLFVAENKVLNKIIEDYDEMSRQIVVEDISAVGVVDEDTGIVF